jgi:hypothetical protein
LSSADDKVDADNKADAIAIGADAALIWIMERLRATDADICQ